jgi:tetratricopeptide (TPR) repeat protein
MPPPSSLLHSAHRALREGDLAAARRYAESAVARFPALTEAWWLLGSAASQLDDIQAAHQAFGSAAQTARNQPSLRAQMLVLQGKPLLADGRVAEAVEVTRAAVKLGIQDAPSLVKASYTLSHAGLSTEALPLAQQATLHDPKHAEGWYSLGSVKRALGDVNGAEAAFNAAIEASPSPPVAAYFNLAYLRRWTREDNHIRTLEALSCQNSLEACRVGYTLFKEYSDIGDYQSAWDCLQIGSELARKLEPWSALEETENYKAWKSTFTAERLAGTDPRPRSGPKRIFIVGLPRSGTTLIERVLASHSQVQAVGELKTFGIATRRLSGCDDPRRVSPAIIKAASRLDPLEIANFYARESDYLSDGSPWVIDKLPANHEYVGLIRLAFPDARIITLNRNPMDALFGSYKVLFTGAYGWSYDLKDLADHYALFTDLMRHWKSALGDDLIEVSLEAVIRDPESEIRSLLSACGLPFEESCLRPHEARGVVSTASAVQVRKPINSEGVGAWRRYESHLAPLQTRLREHGFDV